jgi:REP element-mobilizing transposase RayT
VWYEIRTQINNREPLFQARKVRAIFNRVLCETELRFVFEVRCLRLEDDWLTFYIKPEDGLELPAIMKRLKQTFTQRYNRETGRTGHIWGDRYWSRVLEGEPP